MSARELDTRIQEALQAMGVSDHAQAWEVLSRMKDTSVPDELREPLAAIGLEAVLAHLEGLLPVAATRREVDPVANVLRHGLSVPTKERP